jgi:hypothetical protein
MVEGGSFFAATVIAKATDFSSKRYSSSGTPDSAT